MPGLRMSSTSSGDVNRNVDGVTFATVGRKRLSRPTACTSATTIERWWIGLRAAHETTTTRSSPASSRQLNQYGGTDRAATLLIACSVFPNQIAYSLLPRSPA